MKILKFVLALAGVHSLYNAAIKMYINQQEGDTFNERYMNAMDKIFEMIDPED